MYFGNKWISLVLLCGLTIPSEALETGGKSYFLIASGDFGRYTMHGADTREQASYVDKLILQSLRTNNFEQLLHPTDHADYLERYVCGLKPLSVLIGALGGTNYTTNVLAYDHSLGVGLIVALFEFTQ